MSDTHSTSGRNALRVRSDRMRVYAKSGILPFAIVERMLLHSTEAERELYQEAALPSTRSNSFWSQEVEKQRREYRERVLKDLRAAATGGKVDKGGNYVLPEGVTRGQSDFNMQEEFYEPSGVWWSPSCDRIAVR